MFERTKAAFQKTVRDIKRLIFAFTILGLLVNVAYLAYALIASSGNAIANWILLGTTTAYLLFYLIVTGFGKELDGKKSLKKGGKILFKWLKRMVKVYTIAIAIYGIFSGNDKLNPLVLILIAGQALAVVLGLIFDLIILLIEKRAQLFIDGFMADMEPVLKIKRGAENIKRFFRGEEKIAPPEPTKNQQLLDQLVQEEQERKQQQKQEEKAQRKEKRRHLFGKKQAEAAPASDNAVLPNADPATPALPQAKQKKKGFFFKKP